MTTPADHRYTGYRYPAEVIATVVWLYFRFPLSLRMVEEMLAARGILVSHETVRRWCLKFGREIADGALVTVTPATFRIRPQAVTVYAPERRPAWRPGETR
ncbi:hypothetical protein J2Y49_005972 [Azospirillum sp. BE72]|nr:hypothetical protein [Azospirillum sp. BE72]